MFSKAWGNWAMNISLSLFVSLCTRLHCWHIAYVTIFSVDLMHVGLEVCVFFLYNVIDMVDIVDIVADIG